MTRNNTRTSAPTAALAIALAVPACGSSPGEGAIGGQYALVTVVFSDDERTTYVNLLESLDQLSSIDLADAREFPGLAGVVTLGGKLFVYSADAPTVSRYTPAGTGAWAEEGRVDFGGYGEPDLLTNIFISSQKGYMPFDVTGRVVWDPIALEIAGTQPASPSLPSDRDGLSVRLGYHHAVRGNLAFQPFYWSDADFFAHGSVSQVAIYEAGTDATKGLLDVSCPGIQTITRDEAGTLYFSNSTSAVIPRLFSASAPAPCMTRIKADEETIDSAFSLRFDELTEGRQGGTFQYLANGRGIFQVFHHERITIAPDADPFDVSFSPNWRIWTLDLETRAAAPVDGIDYFGGQYSAFTVGGRTFVLLPSADYSSTAIYEIVSDGTAVNRGDSTGWGYLLIEVR